MMRAMLNIDSVTLSSTMVVTFVDGTPATAEDVLAEQFVIDREDAEYRLLAQAIDRFVAVQRNVKSLNAQEAQA